MRKRATVLHVIICFIFSGFNSILSAEIVTVTEDKSYINMTTSALTVQIKKNPWLISVLDNEKNVLIREKENQALQFGKDRITTLDSFEVMGNTTIIKRDAPFYHAEDEAVIAGETTKFTCSTSEMGTQMIVYVTFRNRWVFSVWMTIADTVLPTKESFITSADEHFLGLGECWDAQSLDLKGLSITMQNREGTPDQGGYVPFYISNKGYGILIDNYLSVNFDFLNPNIVNITAPPISSSVDSTGYFYGSSMLWYFYYGPDLLDVIDRYTEHTSRPALPPPWALFTTWQWRDTNNETGVYKDVKGMRDARIPCGLIWIDRPWATGMANMPPPFEWQADRFPNGQKMFIDLNDMGYKTGVWVAKNLYGDFNNPDLNQKLKNDSQQWIQQNKCQMYKIDRGNVQRMDPYFTCQAYYEAWNDVNHGDFVTLPRTVAFRAQKYVSGMWPGDNDNTYVYPSGLQANIAAMLNLAISGFPYWGSDTGGFPDPPGNSVTARWAQFSSFCPIFQTAGLPYTYPQQYLEIYRKYAELYTQMFPYRWTYARIAHDSGHPITRALMLKYPDDPNVYSQKFEYLYGDWILIAPIVNEGISRDVYLPEGDWIDWWDGTLYNGNQTLSSYHAPEDKLPLFVKSGAIIPMIEIQQTWKNCTVNPMTLRIYPSAMSSFQILGDNITYINQSSPYTNLRDIKIDCFKSNKNIDITISTSDISYILEVHCNAMPNSVSKEGQALQNYTNKSNFETGSKGWYFNPDNGGIVWIKFQGSHSTGHSISIKK